MEADDLSGELELTQERDTVIDEALEVLNANLDNNGEATNEPFLSDLDLLPTNMGKNLEETAETYGRFFPIVDEGPSIDSQDSSWDTLLPHSESKMQTFEMNKVFSSSTKQVRLSDNDLSLFSNSKNSSFYLGRPRMGLKVSNGNLEWSQSHYNQPGHGPLENIWTGSCFTARDLSTNYSGPRESDRVANTNGFDYYSYLRNRMDREHFYVPSLSSTLSGTKVSTALDPQTKRSKTPTAVCTTCFQSISANGGNFQRHQNACLKKQRLRCQAPLQENDEKQLGDIISPEISDDKSFYMYGTKNKQEATISNSMETGDAFTRQAKDELQDAEHHTRKCPKISHILQSFQRGGPERRSNFTTLIGPEATFTIASR